MAALPLRKAQGGAPPRRGNPRGCPHQRRNPEQQRTIIAHRFNHSRQSSTSLFTLPTTVVLLTNGVNDGSHHRIAAPTGADKTNQGLKAAGRKRRKAEARNRSGELSAFEEGGARLAPRRNDPWRRPASGNQPDERLEGTVRSERGNRVWSRRESAAYAAIRASRYLDHPPAGNDPLPLSKGRFRGGFDEAPSKGQANARRSGRRLPSIATRERLQLEPEYKRAMEKGQALPASLPFDSDGKKARRPGSWPAVWRRGRCSGTWKGSGPARKSAAMRSRRRQPTIPSDAQAGTKLSPFGSAKVSPARGGNVQRTKGARTHVGATLVAALPLRFSARGTRRAQRDAGGCPAITPVCAQTRSHKRQRIHPPNPLA